MVITSYHFVRLTARVRESALVAALVTYRASGFVKWCTNNYSKRGCDLFRIPNRLHASTTTTTQTTLRALTLKSRTSSVGWP